MDEGLCDRERAAAAALVPAVSQLVVQHEVWHVRNVIDVDEADLGSGKYAAGQDVFSQPSSTPLALKKVTVVTNHVIK